MTQLTIAADGGGSFHAYLALPPGGEASKAPGLVLVQYICGVNRVMRGIADHFASLGYVVLVPDLYWRQEPGVELVNDPSRPDPQEHAKSLALNQGLDDEAAVRDLQSTLDALRAHPRCNGVAGDLGYCLGGRLAYLMATRTDTDCSVAYYGVNLERYTHEVGRIRKPLLVHTAGQDMLVPEPTRSQILQALAQSPQVTVHEHPGVNHAFALEGGPFFNAQAAATANAQSQDFLAKHLLPA